MTVITEFKRVTLGKEIPAIATCEMNLYADGGCITRNPSIIGGTWAWVLVSNDGTKVFRVDSGVVSAEKIGGPVTNNQMELYALLNGLLYAETSHIKHVYSDSNVSLGRLFRGWSMTNIPDWMINMFREVIRRYPHKPWTNIIELPHTLLDGHPTKAQLAAGIGKRGHLVSKWNVICDKMCKDEAKRYVQRNNNPS